MTKPTLLAINDPAAYRKRCEPRSRDEVNQSAADFFVEMYALMNKHGIADANVVLQMSMRIEADLLEPDLVRETFVSSCFHVGDEAHALEMASYAHAFHRAELEARLGRIKSNAEKLVRG